MLLLVSFNLLSVDTHMYFYAGCPAFLFRGVGFFFGLSGCGAGSPALGLDMLLDMIASLTGHQLAYLAIGIIYILIAFMGGK